MPQTAKLGSDQVSDDQGSDQVTRDQATADQIRESLLWRTLDHARIVSPFYAQRLGHVGAGKRITLSNLASVPLLTKSDLTEHYESICRPLGPPQFIMYTSGTDGKELLVPVAPEEIAAGEKYFSGILPDITDKPLLMSLVRVGHGGQWFSANVPTIPAHVTYGPEQVIALLRRGYSFPGVENQISVLEGNLLTLRSLTSQLKALGIDGREFGLKLVLTTGWYLTARQRRELESFWSAAVMDRYGVTEVNGDAKQCVSCGKFHFDPVVIPEVVHPITKAPVVDGIGGMVLTGLWPFNQVAPKIRYELGDIVRVTSRTGCRVSDPGFEFLGRHNQSVSLVEGENIRYLLFSTEVADVLDEYPEVVRRSKTGFMNFRSTLLDIPKRPVINLEIEWLGNKGNAADEIAERLAARSQFLREALQDNVCSLQVTFLKSDSLEKIHKV